MAYIMIAFLLTAAEPPKESRVNVAQQSAYIQTTFAKLKELHQEGEIANLMGAIERYEASRNQISQEKTYDIVIHALNETGQQMNRLSEFMRDSSKIKTAGSLREYLDMAGDGAALAGTGGKVGSAIAKPLLKAAFSKLDEVHSKDALSQIERQMLRDGITYELMGNEVLTNVLFYAQFDHEFYLAVNDYLFNKLGFRTNSPIKDILKTQPQSESLEKLDTFLKAFDEDVTLKSDQQKQMQQKILTAFDQQTEALLKAMQDQKSKEAEKSMQFDEAAQSIQILENMSYLLGEKTVGRVIHITGQGFLTVAAPYFHYSAAVLKNNAQLAALTSISVVSAYTSMALALMDLFNKSGPNGTELILEALSKFEFRMNDRLYLLSQQIESLRKENYENFMRIDFRLSQLIQLTNESMIKISRLLDKQADHHFHLSVVGSQISDQLRQMRSDIYYVAEALLTHGVNEAKNRCLLIPREEELQKNPWILNDCLNKFFTLAFDDSRDLFSERPQNRTVDNLRSDSWLYQNTIKSSSSAELQTLSELLSAKYDDPSLLRISSQPLANWEAWISGSSLFTQTLEAHPALQKQSSPLQFKLLIDTGNEVAKSQEAIRKNKSMITRFIDDYEMSLKKLKDVLAEKHLLYGKDHYGQPAIVKNGNKTHKTKPEDVEALGWKDIGPCEDMKQTVFEPIHRLPVPDSIKQWTWDHYGDLEAIQKGLITICYHVDSKIEDEVEEYTAGAESDPQAFQKWKELAYPDDRQGSVKKLLINTGYYWDSYWIEAEQKRARCKITMIISLKTDEEKLPLLSVSYEDAFIISRRAVARIPKIVSSDPNEPYHSHNQREAYNSYVRGVYDVLMNYSKEGMPLPHTIDMDQKIPEGVITRFSEIYRMPSLKFPFEPVEISAEHYVKDLGNTIARADYTDQDEGALVNPYNQRNKKEVQTFRDKLQQFHQKKELQNLEKDFIQDQDLHKSLDNLELTYHWMNTVLDLGYRWELDQDLFLRSLLFGEKRLLSIADLKKRINDLEKSPLGKISLLEEDLQIAIDQAEALKDHFEKQERVEAERPVSLIQIEIAHLCFLFRDIYPEEYRSFQCPL